MCLKYFYGRFPAVSKFSFIRIDFFPEAALAAGGCKGLCFVGGVVRGLGGSIVAVRRVFRVSCGGVLVGSECLFVIFFIPRRVAATEVFFESGLRRVCS